MKLKAYFSPELGPNGVRIVQLLGENAAAPEAPTVFLGDIEHIPEDDNLPGFQKMMENHAIYHHVANLLYVGHGVQDMSRIVIVSVDDVGPGPDPTELMVNSTDFLLGVTGSRNTTKAAGKTYFRGAQTVWAGMIKGTEAILHTFSDYSNAGEGLVDVSIDGAAFTSINAPDGRAVLFTGLDQAERFVVVRWSQLHGDVCNIVNGDGVMEIRGDAAALRVFQHWASHNGPTGVGLLGENPDGFTPPLLLANSTVNTTNTCSVALRGPFKELVIMGTGPGKYAYSKNGGPPVYVGREDEENNPATGLRIQCDGSLSTYNVWNMGTFQNEGGHFSVSGDVPNQLASMPKLIQWGDSMTAGAGPGANAIHTEVMRVAAALGFVGSACGISGLTIEGEQEVLDRLGTAQSIGAADVAILAIGGNNADGGFDSTELANYGNCIEKLLASGFQRVICRGILPLAGSESTINGLNDLLNGVVTDLADPRVTFLDPRSWGTYDTQDGVHATEAGYDTIASKAIPAYRAELGL